MAFKENSSEGTIPDTNAKELVSAPTAKDRTKNVFGVTLYNPNGGAIQVRLEKKKGGTAYVISRANVGATAHWVMPAEHKQILKETDESIQAVAESSPGTPIDYTVQWADIF